MSGWGVHWGGSIVPRQHISALLHLLCCSLLTHFPRPLLPARSALLAWALPITGSLKPMWWAHKPQQAEPELWLSVKSWARAQGLGKEKWFLVGMSCLVRQGCGAKVRNPEEAGAGFGFCTSSCCCNNLCVPSNKSWFFLSLDFKLHWSALAAEGSNTAYGRLWLPEHLRTPGQPLCFSFVPLSPVPFGVWAHWARARGEQRLQAGHTQTRSGIWAKSGVWGPSSRSASPSPATQQCGHALWVQAAGWCSLPPPSCAASLSSCTSAGEGVWASPMPLSAAQPESRLMAAKQPRKLPQWSENVLL